MCCFAAYLVYIMYVHYVKKCLFAFQKVSIRFPIYVLQTSLMWLIVPKMEIYIVSVINNQCCVAKEMRNKIYEIKERSEMIRV
jgi:hypothetical protein